MKLTLRHFYSLIFIGLLSSIVLKTAHAASFAGVPAADGPLKAPAAPVLPMARPSTDDPIRDIGGRVISMTDSYVDYLINMYEFISENMDDFLQQSGYVKTTTVLDTHIQADFETSALPDILSWKSIQASLKGILEDPEMPSIDKANQMIMVLFSENLRYKAQRARLEGHRASEKIKKHHLCMLEDQEVTTSYFLEELLALMPAKYREDYKRYQPFYMRSEDQNGGGKEKVKRSRDTSGVEIIFPNGYRCKIPDQPIRPPLSIMPILDGTAGAVLSAGRLPTSAFVITLPSSGISFMLRAFPTQSLRNTIDAAYGILTGVESVDSPTPSKIFPDYAPAPRLASAIVDSDDTLAVVKAGPKKPRQKGKKGKPKPKPKPKPTPTVHAGVEPESSDEEEDVSGAGAPAVMAPPAEPEPAKPVPPSVRAETSDAGVDAVPSVVAPSKKATKAAAPVKATPAIASVPPISESVALHPLIRLTYEQQLVLSDIISITRTHRRTWPEFVATVNALGGRTVGKTNMGIFEFAHLGGLVHIKTYYPHATGGTPNGYTAQSLLRGLAKIGLDKDTLKKLCKDLSQ